ncbi:MAG: hypothetical protein QOJ39_1149 [Candidatus Eremiobacteraeota bacterium]|jgi:hypothetical protein|nr:hypothetical protein [Candidatus Eremiobacteraeota bacterium]
MKRSAVIAFAALLAPAGVLAAAQSTPVALAQTTPAPSASVPAAGVVPLGVTVIEMQAVVAGWSVKKDLLGKGVQNEKKENLGKIEDIILSRNDSASFAIIGVGGFLGIGERLVAIPMSRIKLQSGQLVLAGATKDNIRAMPPFVYAH